MPQWSEDKIHIPTGISKMRSTREMRARRKRSRCMQEIILVGMFYVNVRLAIDLSLAKISEADSRLAASTSDYYAMIKTCILYSWQEKNHLCNTYRLVIED